MDIPSKEIMKKNGVFNKLSKIYWPHDKDIIFNTIQEAKNYFWTNEAQELFRYCCEEKYQLTKDNKGLHWTVGFGEPDNQTPGMIKWADLWRDGKQELHNNRQWWNNIPIIEHNSDDLF
jgi:hypothetical protein